MSWRRLLGLEEKTPVAPSVPMVERLTVVSLRGLGPVPHRVARAGAASEVRFIPSSASFRSGGVCLVAAGELSATGVGTAGPGDLLAGPPREPLVAGPSGAVVLVEWTEEGYGGTALVPAGKDEGAGEGFPGVSGLRVLLRHGPVMALRLGPPPGARWAVTGLHALAVFRGRLTVLDDGQPTEVGAWETVLVGDPSATLHVVVGNDSVRAVGFASARVAVALG